MIPDQDHPGTLVLVGDGLEVKSNRGKIHGVILHRSMFHVRIPQSLWCKNAFQGTFQDIHGMVDFLVGDIQGGEDPDILPACHIDQQSV